ncbi:alpha-N-arabinofuranosidase [Microbacterium suwonense]|uniref:non-reducing end alpha-L-arabinofuranosidase n=1 Tax=Microbacterium suwonense TaxID=683047 RepID=A0ABM8FUY3_9MICO|nr:alpha-L-arabinofuranosidase C-terminal domain-containing protein [Microbacterium suwonense]BDZ39500.1 intracellular exo-alpha-L-arabinofuranosidase 2 [Microbacterium suwonense]
MITLSRTLGAPTIDRRIYGQFAEHLGRCIYEGVWVGESSDIPHRNGLRTDVIDALRQIRVPLVRWPGGCFADEYHWLKGVGPDRQPMVNTHWGGVVESNEFGTHEYFELLNQLDAEAYINGNVGSGTVAEMQDWIEYMTLDSTSPMAELRKRHGREQPWKLEFFGVGNESWGCGGNMLPLHYANQYRQFQTYVRRYGEHPISKIACGANADDYEWTETLMARAVEHMDGLSLHYYTLPTADWDRKGSALDFSDFEWHETLRQARRMDEMVTRHSRIMDRHDPTGRVGLIVDEWGTWYDVDEGTDPGFLYQQNTLRDAAVAAITLNIFHRHADRVRMANIAQMVNVLQAMILTDGGRMLTTPTYHVFDLYTDHQDAEYVDVPIGALGADVDATASYKDGAYTVSLTNTALDREAKAGFALPAAVTDVLRAQVLGGTSATAHNTFDTPDAVVLSDIAVSVSGDEVTLTLPPHSVATVRVAVAE